MLLINLKLIENKKITIDEILRKIDFNMEKEKLNKKNKKIKNQKKGS